MPYQKPVLSLEEARKGIIAMLEEAGKAPNRPVAIAICDDPVSYTHLTLPTICSV